MTNFVDLVNHTADQFEKIICEQAQNLQEIETPDFGWSNKRWFSQQFRLAHVERFQQPKFSVLHTVIFPHVTDPSAIFGFDIIASDTKATGLFFDLSPTLLPSEPLTDLVFSEPRDRPEWGSIFGEHWIACRPTFEEFVVISDLACRTLEKYLVGLSHQSTHRVHEVIQAQNRYSLQQRQNEHTTRVIKKLLGPDQGEYFINHILFPTVETID